MDPISNADRIAAVLRQTLRERLGPGRSGTAARGDDSASHLLSRLSAARAIAAIRGINDRERRRALVQALLAQKFGLELLNDAHFQQLVSRVSQVIEDDAEIVDYLTRIMKDLHNT